MVMIILCICSQLEVNDIVGKEIDSLEARKYYLFTDVEDFVSACFNDSGDSIIVGMNFVRNETIRDSSVVISRDALKALNSYIRNFRLIIEDEDFRRSFVETFNVAWPIVSHSQVSRVAKSTSGRRIWDTSCCVTGGCALGAYASVLITRKVRTEVDTIGIPVGCWAGNGGCTIIVPIEITRKIYRINPVAYVGGAAIGSGLGYSWAKEQSKSRHVIFEAIGKDIVAFDNAGSPITEKEVAAADKGTNAVLFGTLGLAAGLLGAGATAIGLISPWADMEPEKEWHGAAVYVPITLICGVEIVFITNYFAKKGQKMDRQATIERLRSRHSEQ